MSNLDGKLKIWSYVIAVIAIIIIIIGVIIARTNLIGLLILGLGAILIIIGIILLKCYDKESEKVSNEKTGKPTVPSDPTNIPVTPDPSKPTAPLTQDDNSAAQSNENESANSDRVWKNLTCAEKAFKLIGIIILIFGLTYVICSATIHQDLYGLGIVGLGSFVVVLAAAFCLSDKWDLREGEFRKALTISVGAVYFYSLALSDKIYTINTTNNIAGNLTNTTILLNSTTNVTTINATITSQITQWSMVEPLFNNLWAVFLAIVSFYFFTGWIEKIKGK
jgi:hypothetical protein